MKKYLSFIENLIFLFLILISSCQNNLLTPSDYHQRINKLYRSLDSTLLLMVKDVYKKDATKKLLTEDYNSALEMIRKNMDTLNSIKELPNDPGFLRSTQEFYITCDSMIKNNFKDVIDIYSQVEWSDEKGAKIDDSMKEIYQIIIDKEQRVRNKENDFALEYGIVLPKE